MRSITALSIANDAIRAAVIADPYSDLPTIKHFQAIPLPNGAVVDGAKWSTMMWWPDC